MVSNPDTSSMKKLEVAFMDIFNSLNNTMYRHNLFV